MRVALALAVVAGATLAGCSTAGNGNVGRLEPSTAPARLVVGTTTEADARRLFGEGREIRFESGWRTWHYLDKAGLSAAWDDVPYVGLVTSRIDRPTHELVLLFDDGGVLRRWSLQEGRSSQQRGVQR